MNIAIIGCGNMGSALVRGLAQQPGHHLVVSDRTESKVTAAAEGAVSEVVYAPGVAQAAHSAEVVLLVVKPKYIADVLQEAAEHAPDDALFISCAAGVEMATLEATSGLSARTINALRLAAQQANKALEAIRQKRGNVSDAHVETTSKGVGTDLRWASIMATTQSRANKLSDEVVRKDTQLEEVRSQVKRLEGKVRH